jgi:methylenetetrahydrofolate reductase (NADPH)
MKVIEHIKKAISPLISFEITPPERGGDINKDLKVVEALSQYNPSFIHVTSRSADVEEEEKPGGLVKKIVRRKRPGTLGLCYRIGSEYKLDSPIHLLCKGFDREETEDLLIDLEYGGLTNIFAVQGDVRYKKVIPSDKTVNTHASDLIQQIKGMNEDFCIGVAGYPEKHGSAPNFKTDIMYLKQKIDLGAEYVITQMFFDNEKYFRFLDMCRKEGINVPIIPGITAIVSETQLEGEEGMPEKFNIWIPKELSDRIYAAKNKEDVKKIGIEWTTLQAQELRDQKVPATHFFIYGNAKSIIEVADNLGLSSH